MKIVVLIGTSHIFRRPKSTGAYEFLSFIEHVCNVFNILAIGEEMSLEGLLENNESQSVSEQFANIRNLPHRYCDPDSSERKLLGVRQGSEIEGVGFLGNWSQEKIEREIKESYAIRERCWLERLAELDAWPVLFICGANHIQSFSSLLASNGFQIHIAAKDWEPN